MFLWWMLRLLRNSQAIYPWMKFSSTVRHIDFGLITNVVETLTHCLAICLSLVYLGFSLQQCLLSLFSFIILHFPDNLQPCYLSHLIKRSKSSSSNYLSECHLENTSISWKAPGSSSLVLPLAWATPSRKPPSNMAQLLLSPAPNKQNSIKLPPDSSAIMIPRVKPQIFLQPCLWS